MFKHSVKPIWAATFLLLGGVAISLKIALASVYPVFVPKDGPVGYVAADAMTNNDLRSGNELLFRVEYHREFWDGSVVAYALNSEADLATATQPWGGGGAATKLDGQTKLDITTDPLVPTVTGRIIVTRNGSTNIPFAWSSLSSTQKAAIDSVSAGASAAYSPVMNFLRGDRTREIQQGGTYRRRESIMGDIIHSKPYYVSDGYKPEYTTTQITSSATPPVITNVKNLVNTQGKNPTVFVGANDGMLHAIDAVTGNERWAYVPSMLIPKLKNLSVNPYVHDYFVDGSMDVGTTTSGQRILAGSLGGGGIGLFALDISTSSRLAPTTDAGAADNILWEITNASTGFANLGYTYAKPTVAKISDSQTAVVVGNGYNNTGDYQAYLYVIDAASGSLIRAIQAGTTGTAARPNGLSTAVLIDADANGISDTAYAGDMDGTLWKFDIAAGTSKALLTTSPAQPITMSPGVSTGPLGGFMVNFATGSMLTTADTTDTAVFAAYGVWDGAPVGNTTLLTQTLTERCYTAGTTTAASPCANRVRTVTSNQPDWAVHKGWRVPLPASEKVTGDGSYTDNGRFYFTSYNPTISTAIPATTTTVMGENWLMELNYLTGGSTNAPVLDLNNDHVITDDDRVKDNTKAPVMSTDGVPVGKTLKIGVMSQPVLVLLTNLNNTLFNQNPDATIVPIDVGDHQGVTGGHFDVDIFYGDDAAGTAATATITVGTSGQTNGYPATLGGLQVDGVTILPALTTSDLTNGTSTSNNATTINGKITGGFTATRNNSTITITAPPGASFNGKSISILNGTSQTLVPASAAVPGVPAVAPVGTLVISAVPGSTSTTGVSIQCGATTIEGPFTIASGTNSARLNDLNTRIGNSADVAGYNTTCTRNRSGNTTNSLTCTVTAPVGPAACTTFTLNKLTATTNSGPSGGKDAVPPIPAVSKSGWTDFSSALTVTKFSGGSDGSGAGDSCTGSNCQYKTHFHQYDDKYDVTGLNPLNPSSPTLHIGLGIPLLTTDFKVIVGNQYLSPALQLHIGDPTYDYAVEAGYFPLKNYTTGSDLDPRYLQTYRRGAVNWTGNALPTAPATIPLSSWYTTAPTATQLSQLAAPRNIGSLAINMPTTALTASDWWGNGDIRSGLHPTVYSCVWQAAGSNDGNMYQPVVPPTNGTDGPGKAGYKSGRTGSTTPATATGVRHNGALTIQLISADTPKASLELSVPGRPEYGWRVKSADYGKYVFMEYAIYWHHPNGKCYDDTGWTKQPDPDTANNAAGTRPAGTTDPKTGDLSAATGTIGGTIVSSVTTVTGAVSTTTITYTTGQKATIVRTVNSDGTVTIVTTDATGKATTQTIANASGSLATGGDERRDSQAATGRVSWRELLSF